MLAIYFLGYMCVLLSIVPYLQTHDSRFTVDVNQKVIVKKYCKYYIDKLTP